MWSFGSPDSKFMQTMELFAQAIWLTVLMIVTSLPIVTIGAAITAGHDVARRLIRGEARMTRAYARCFAQNFLKSTVIWLVMGPTLAVILWAWIAVRLTPLLIVQFACSIIWLIVAEWVFALQARFENTVRRTFTNALIFGVSYWSQTLGMLLIDSVFIMLLYASILYFPQGLPLVVLLGWGLIMMLHTPLLESIFRHYIK